jgi:hypothetical protein
MCCVCLRPNISLDVNSIGSSSIVPLIGLRGRPSIDEDFLHLHPKKSIAESKEVGESDTFIVCATIDGIVEGQKWRYPSLIEKKIIIVMVEKITILNFSPLVV